MKLKKLIRILPAGLYYGLIWYISSSPAPVDVSGCDKTVHIIEYGVLGFLMALGFNLGKENISKLGVFCFLLAAFLGALDEVHQHFVPARSMDFLDWTADTAGISLGILLWLLVTQVIFKKNIKVDSE